MSREVEANDLTNVDVEFISLVKHAASRLPLRVVKNEQDKKGGITMDFFNLFKKDDDLQAALKKQEDADAAVANAAAEAARKLLEEQGFTITKGDVPPQFKKKPKDGEEQDDSVTAPSAEDAAAADAEAAKMKKAEDDEKARLAKIDELKGQLAELEKAEPQKTTPKKMAGKVNGSKGANDDGKGVAAADGGEGVDDDEDIGDKPVHGNDQTGDAKKMVKKLDDLAEGQTALAKSLGELNKVLKGLDTRLSAAETSIKKTDGALRSTIVGTPQDDPEPQTRVRKSVGAPALMDTGMNFND